MHYKKGEENVLLFFLRRDMAPVTVIGPRCFLAVLAAILCAAATAAFRKLPLELLPLPALVIGTLANPTSRLVLAAEISHNNRCPVLHVFRMVPDRELLDQWKDINVVRQ